jgi:hypothetical protein
MGTDNAAIAHVTVLLEVAKAQSVLRSSTTKKNKILKHRGKE